MHGERVLTRWTIRSSLVAVADLDRSIAFYRNVGPFDEILCQDGVAVLGEMSPSRSH